MTPHPEPRIMTTAEPTLDKGTIRERVIAYLERQPERTDWALEVFDQIGCRSWPTFCREVHRMERMDDLVLDTDGFECTSIGLPDDQEGKR